MFIKISIDLKKNSFTETLFRKSVLIVVMYSYLHLPRYQVGSNQRAQRGTRTSLNSRRMDTVILSPCHTVSWHVHQHDVHLPAGDTGSCSV